LLLVQAADLEGGDDAHGPVVLAPVAVRVAVRSDSEDGRARGAVSGNEGANRVLGDYEAQAFERVSEVVERASVLRRIRVPSNRLGRPCVWRGGEMLDVLLDPSGAALAVDHRRIVCVPRRGS